MRITLLAVFLSALPAAAAEAPHILSWDDCVQTALGRNPDLASSRFAYKAGKYAFYGSFNGLLPQLTISDSYRTLNNSNGSSRWQAAGTANLNVFNMSQIANIKSSYASMSFADAALRQTSSAVRFNLRSAGKSNPPQTRCSAGQAGSAHASRDSGPARSGSIGPRHGRRSSLYRHGHGQANGLLGCVSAYWGDDSRRGR